jgi:aspartate aminotransferase
MKATEPSATLLKLAVGLGPILDFLTNSEHAKREGDPNMCDFVFGNPHEMPLEGLAETLQRHIVPKNKDWFAYKLSQREATEPVAASLTTSHGVRFDPEDIAMTPGSFGALAVSFRALLDPGDEVIFLSPPWFFYEAMIAIAGGVPVRVTLEPPEFNLDAEAIRAALTPRTRAIIVNSPHNPSGRIYSRSDLEALGAVLADAPAEKPVVLLSDESYRRILFDGRSFVSPAGIYPHTWVLYTFGKTLLAPGERIGYIALPSSFPGRESFRDAIQFAQVVGGWQFPNASLQRAVADLDRLSIDVPALQARRDRLADALRAMGYELIVPEGTFYMMVRSPIPDDVAFTNALAAHDVFVGPGLIFELPGWFRISLTANDDMVERSLPGFVAALKSANA